VPPTTTDGLANITASGNANTSPTNGTTNPDTGAVDTGDTGDTGVDGTVDAGTVDAGTVVEGVDVGTVASTGGTGTCTPTGVTSADSTDTAPSPCAFDATTVNVYPVPFDNPDTEHDTAPNVEHEPPPGDAVTVYPVTEDPPVTDGATHDTTTLASPATPDTPVGAPGTSSVTADTVPAGLEPAGVFATTLNVYAEPATKPDMVHDVDGVEHEPPPDDAVTV
jgi:hypothetical protein